MHGPAILARTMTVAMPKGKENSLWQYHPRSDHHSKVACWGILFDLLHHSQLLREHVASGRLVFGINHEMRDFRTGFRSLMTKWGILWNEEERRVLDVLPDAVQHSVRRSIWREAKVCMTERGNGRPRLYDELSSRHDTLMVRPTWPSPQDSSRSISRSTS